MSKKSCFRILWLSGIMLFAALTGYSIWLYNIVLPRKVAELPLKDLQRTGLTAFTEPNGTEWNCGFDNFFNPASFEVKTVRWNGISQLLFPWQNSRINVTQQWRWKGINGEDCFYFVPSGTFMTRVGDNRQYTVFNADNQIVRSYGNFSYSTSNQWAELGLPPLLAEPTDLTIVGNLNIEYSPVLRSRSQGKISGKIRLFQDVDLLLKDTPYQNINEETTIEYGNYVAANDIDIKGEFRNLKLQQITVTPDNRHQRLYSLDFYGIWQPVISWYNAGLTIRPHHGQVTMQEDYTNIETQPECIERTVLNLSIPQFEADGQNTELKLTNILNDTVEKLHLSVFGTVISAENLKQEASSAAALEQHSGRNLNWISSPFKLKIDGQYTAGIYQSSSGIILTADHLQFTLPGNVIINAIPDSNGKIHADFSFSNTFYPYTISVNEIELPDGIRLKQPQFKVDSDKVTLLIKSLPYQNAKLNMNIQDAKLGFTPDGVHLSSAQAQGSLGNWSFTLPAFSMNKIDGKTTFSAVGGQAKFIINTQVRLWTDTLNISNTGLSAKLSFKSGVLAAGINTELKLTNAGGQRFETAPAAVTQAWFNLTDGSCKIVHPEVETVNLPPNRKAAADGQFGYELSADTDLVFSGRFAGTFKSEVLQLGQVAAQWTENYPQTEQSPIFHVTSAAGSIYGFPAKNIQLTWQWSEKELQLRSFQCRFMNGQLTMLTPERFYLENIDAALLCEQLLQLPSAQISGTVDGVVSPFMKDGKLCFNPSSIATYPGQFGNAKFPKLPEFTADDIAKNVTCDALADFNYNYLRFDLTGRQVIFSANGTPASPLVYTMDSSTGRFRPAEDADSAFQDEMTIELEYNL